MVRIRYWGTDRQVCECGLKPLKAESSAVSALLWTSEWAWTGTRVDGFIPGSYRVSVGFGTTEILNRVESKLSSIEFMDCCKVGTVADKRSVTVTADEDIHAYLVARWLGIDDYPAMGVRKLADWFNRKLLRDAYTRHGRNVTDVRISSEYEALTGDSDLEREEVIDDLRSDGLDGEALIDDFVSRSTMRRHLTNCLDASKEEDDTADAGSAWELEQIQHSSQHLKRKVEESIQSLDNKEKLPGGGDADVEVSIFLLCPECSTQVRLQTALDRQFICKDHLGSSSLATSEIVTLN